MRIYGHRRLLTGFAVLTSLALLAGACGGDEGGETPPPGEASGEIRVVSNWTGSEGEAFQAVIDAFHEKNPKVTVKVEQVPFDQTQALLTQQFAAGSPPDVAVALPGIIRTFAEQGLLLDLDRSGTPGSKDGAYTDVAAADRRRPGRQGLRRVLQGQRQRARLVLAASSSKKLGIAVPKTWAEFTAAMDKAKADGVAPLAVGGKDGWPLTQWTDPVILRVAGAEAFNDLARGKIGWDDPRIVKSFQVLGDLIGKYFPQQTLATGFIDATCAGQRARPCSRTRARSST